MHFCLGSQLARAELQIALETLLTKLPGLRVEGADQDLAWKQGLLIRGFRELPVSW